MVIFKDNENIVLYDPQSNEIFKEKEIDLILYSIRRSTIKLIKISTCNLNKAVVDLIMEERL